MSSYGRGGKIYTRFQSHHDALRELAKRAERRRDGVFQFDVRNENFYIKNTSKRIHNLMKIGRSVCFY